MTEKLSQPESPEERIEWYNENIKRMRVELEEAQKEANVNRATELQELLRSAEGDRKLAQEELEKK